MRRFFFDVFDGEKLWADSEGTEHADLAAARHEAVDTITSMSREVFPLDGASSISIDIRGGDGAAIERVIVTLSFQKL
jgi:hypothetical protein